MPDGREEQSDRLEVPFLAKCAAMPAGAWVLHVWLREGGLGVLGTVFLVLATYVLSIGSILATAALFEGIIQSRGEDLTPHTTVLLPVALYTAIPLLGLLLRAKACFPSEPFL